MYAVVNVCVFLNATFTFISILFDCSCLCWWCVGGEEVPPTRCIIHTCNFMNLHVIEFFYITYICVFICIRVESSSWIYRLLLCISGGMLASMVTLPTLRTAYLYDYIVGNA